MKYNVLIIGLMPPDEVLKKRISVRAEKMFKAGIIKETEQLLSKYGESALLKAAGIVYKLCLEVISHKITEEEAIGLFKAADWQYARRQRTWFRRNKFINWHESSAQAYEEVYSVLNN